MLAAVGCGAAGGLILANSLFVEPNSIFGIQYTAYMIFMVLIGGLGTIEAPIVDGFGVRLVPVGYRITGIEGPQSSINLSAIQSPHEEEALA